MNEFQSYYRGDLARYGHIRLDWWMRRFHFYHRKVNTCRNPFLRKLYLVRYVMLSRKHGVEISWRARIGRGFFIDHPYGISINSDAVLGENVNLSKGVTIGKENRGVRKGAPTIGSRVWIGVNATIVGNITIGDDVLIAPNAFVNRSIPAHSVVVGNPCSWVHRDGATEDYINSRIPESGTDGLC